jgi:hypothetical protein
MSLWQFCAAIGGWAKANGALPDRLNKEDAARLSAKFKALRPDLR